MRALAYLTRCERKSRKLRPTQNNRRSLHADWQSRCVTDITFCSSGKINVHDHETRTTFSRCMCVCMQAFFANWHAQGCNETWFSLILHLYWFILCLLNKRLFFLGPGDCIVAFSLVSVMELLLRGGAEDFFTSRKWNVCAQNALSCYIKIDTTSGVFYYVIKRRLNLSDRHIFRLDEEMWHSLWYYYSSHCCFRLGKTDEVWP